MCRGHRRSHGQRGSRSPRHGDVRQMANKNVCAVVCVRDMYNKEWYHANKDRINEKRRLEYARASDAIKEERHEKYMMGRDRVLNRRKHDREECPMCRLTFCRRYLEKHIATRHQCAIAVH